MPETKKVPPLTVRNARLLFRNFSGSARLPYNAEGQRNFNVILEPSLATKLLEEGWRVKQLDSREEGEEGDYILKVNVNYSTGRPPRVVLLSSRGPTELGADEIGSLDFLDYENVDLTVNGYWNEMAGGGFGAYLRTLFFTVREDELEKEYASMLPSADSQMETLASQDQELVEAVV